MSCIYKYKGKDYTKEEFYSLVSNSNFIQQEQVKKFAELQERLNNTGFNDVSQLSKEDIEKVDKIFKKYSELANLFNNNKELYNSYLRSIFPEASEEFKGKLFFHGTKNPIEGSKFKISDRNLAKGLWFTKQLGYAKRIESYKEEGDNPLTYGVILNIKNPKHFHNSSGALLVQRPSDFEKQYDRKNNDAAVFHHPESSGGRFTNEGGYNQVVIFDENQVHIIGDEIDIIKAKEFLKSQIIPQQEQAKKFQELQERLNNKEFLEGAKNAFESSEELQNVYYEAAGFIVPNNVKVRGRVFYAGKEFPNTFQVTFETTDGKYIGFAKINNNSIDSIELQPEFRKKGLGTEIYVMLGEELASKGITLESAFYTGSNLTNQAKSLWESLIRKGYATKTENNYKFISKAQQKQQARQLYAQYLDTIFPESQVKDIVYHGTNEKFDKFDKNKLGTKTVNETNKLGFYFSTRRIAEIFNGNFNLSDFLFIRDNEEKSTEFFEKLQTRYGREQAIKIYKELISLTNDSTGLHSLSKLDAPDSRIISVLLNIKNPFYIEGIDFIGMTRKGGFEGTKLIKNKIKNKDSIIIKKATEEFAGEDEVQDDNYIVFEPEQIHIVSSKADIQGFKDFMSFENSEFSKYGTYQQFRDFITSKFSIEIENRLIETGKINRVC